jgi:hypothetical protein
MVMAEGRLSSYHALLRQRFNTGVEEFVVLECEHWTSSTIEEQTFFNGYAGREICVRGDGATPYLPMLKVWATYPSCYSGGFSFTPLLSSLSCSSLAFCPSDPRPTAAGPSPSGYLLPTFLSRSLASKLKDFPAQGHFKDRLRRHYSDFLETIGSLLPEYTHPEVGPLNLGTRFPSTALPPDLGPKVRTTQPPSN